LSINEWNIKILELWNSYNLYTTNFTQETLVNVEFKTFSASELINIYDFNDGKTIIDIIENGTLYLGFAVTRFRIDPTDRNWTWFLIVKYREETGFWDGIIKISEAEFYEYIRNNMLFLNFEYSRRSHEIEYLYRTVISINNNIINRKVPIVYFIDNNDEVIKTMNVEIIEIILEGILKEYYISFMYDNINNKNTYVFSILSDEILFGKLLWNVEINEAEIQLIKPIDLNTGKEL
jgi:hypothetical protein